MTFDKHVAINRLFFKSFQSISILHKFNAMNLTFYSILTLYEKILCETLEDKN